MWAITPPIFILSLILTLVITKNPITLGAMIFLLASLAWLMTSISMSSWFGLALFIIFVGGLMVMFAYFITLTPNQRLSLSIPLIMTILLSSILHLLNMDNISNYTMINFSSMNKFSGLMIYDSNTAPILLILVALLFLALILVVKITKIAQGPLRFFN